MTTIALELERKLQSVDAETAGRLERLVRDALELAQIGASSDGFEQLVAEESALREKLRQAGRQFSAQDRLSREAVHDRDALH